MMKAIAYFSEKKNKETVVEIGKAILCQPNNADLYLFRAETYHIMGNHEEAKKDIETAKKLTPSTSRIMESKSPKNNTVEKMII